MSELWPQIEKESTTLQVNINSQIIVRSQTNAAIGIIAEEIAQHVKGNDDRKAIITEEPKSHLGGIL